MSHGETSRHYLIHGNFVIEKIINPDGQKSPQCHVQHHHHAESQRKADSADVGVLALGHFGNQLLDHDVDHGPGGKAEQVGQGRHHQPGGPDGKQCAHRLHGTGQRTRPERPAAAHARGFQRHRNDSALAMKDGVITNDNRINAALPTIKKLINDGAKVILCSHLGKPKNGPEAKFSLAPVAVRLSEKLGQPVTFADDDNVVGNQAKAAVATMGNGDVVLLQNTRFRKEETKNIEPTFSEELASLADAYVDDAFGSCHRAHCSTAGVTDYVKDTAVGYLMEKEIKYLGNAVNNPERPFTAILGGAKVADKLNVISNLLEKVDTLIIGGGMAYTFLKAQGYEIGKSLVDDSKIDYCKEMMAKAQEKGVKLLLPVDAACVADFPDPIDAPVEVKVVPVTAIPADMEGCDIGPESMKLFADAVKASKTVVWNGPMGVFENPTLAAGTLAVAKAMAESGATTVIGGGDSAAAVQQMGLGDKMTHISTGGGASLEYLEGKELPGIAVIQNA